MLIDADGEPVPSAGHDVPAPTRRWSRALGAMVTARRLNDQAYALVRQGRLAVYPSSHGQEACQVAAAQVLADDDWLFPTYRDTVGMRGPRRRPGRGADAAQGRLALRLRPLRAQRRTAGHAAGHPAASTPSASRTRRGSSGERHVVMAMCGDGATSEGDFHEALNFAAVFQAPGGLLRAEQRVRHQRARWPGRRWRRRWRTRASATAYRASGSTATTWPRCSPSSAPRSSAPAPARDRSWSRRTRTGCRPTPTPTTPPATARTTRSPRGSSATRSPGSRPTCAAAAC